MIRHKPDKVEAFQTSMVATIEEHEQQENQDNLNKISEEKDDAKPPISTETFGSDGGNDSTTSSKKTPTKKVVETVSKELDNELEDMKVERDAKREGEPTILATFRSDCGITIWDPGMQYNFFRQHLEDKMVFECVKSVTPVLQEDPRSPSPYDIKIMSYNISFLRSSHTLEVVPYPDTTPAINITVGNKEDSNVKDKQEVKKVDDQEIKNVKDEKGKKVKDQQVYKQTINEIANTITSLQSKVEKLPMELLLKNNFREALETTSKDLEKKMIDLIPTLHDLQKVKTKCALKMMMKSLRRLSLKRPQRLEYWQRFMVLDDHPGSHLVWLFISLM
nr:hypothetical protein [Tanacetum cinerariifolium]